MNNMPKYLILLLAGAILLTGCKQKQGSVDNIPYVIMLSMDGFRWDYTDMYDTPNFDRIAGKGVKAESMQACFPTKTFPNHYSIATGLYPDHHGLVNNSFYAPDLDLTYTIQDRKMVTNPDFYKGEPVWVTAEKQDIITASFFWVGSEAAVQGIQPTYWKTYEHKFPYEQRIDTVIHWLELPPDIRPHFISWYVDQPDSRGHQTGPLNKELETCIVYLDSLLGIFLDKTMALPIADKLNIIITSDHGMGPISSERNINLTEYIDTSLMAHINGSNPVYNLTAKAGGYEQIWESLSSIPHVSVWKREEIPEVLHYGNNPRVGDFVILADSSWSIMLRDPKEKFSGGTHGYDNRNKDMHAIFYAFGPAFKCNYTQPVFDNIDIYPLICEILQINPAPVDGKLSNVIGMLKE